MPNGDLWELVDKIVEQRGLESNSIDWVKGHATPAQVQKGITTSRDRLRNESADTTANLGVQSHGDHLIDLARVFAYRRVLYLRICSAIQAFLVKVFHFENEAREADLKRQSLLGSF